MEENARKISELGRNLYEAVRVLGGHFDDLGAKLKASLDAYNQAVGSLEGNVLVKARKFKELSGGQRRRGDQGARADRSRAADAAGAPSSPTACRFQADDAELIEEVKEVEQVLGVRPSDRALTPLHPTPQRDDGPRDLDQAEGPRALEKSINGRRSASRPRTRGLYAGERSSSA